MYAVVYYNDYRKEVDFKIHMVTNDLKEAMNAGFHYATEKLKQIQGVCKNDNCEFKITTNNESNNYVECLNRTVLTYTVVCLSKNKDTIHKLEYADTSIHAVVELPREINNVGNTDLVDFSLLCNDYYPDYYSLNEDDE